MKSPHIGILRVLTTDNEAVLMAHQNKLQDLFPLWSFSTRCIPDQYNGIHDDETHNAALPKIRKLAEEWENDLDGLIISCAGDPGVEELRGLLSIPVIGGGIAASSLSLTMGRRVGVIGIENHCPSSYIRILGDHFGGYILPDGIRNTNDLRTETGKKSVVKAAADLKVKGCDVIAFACTGLTTAGAASLIYPVGLPVVDAVVAEGIAMDVMLKSSGWYEG